MLNTNQTLLFKIVIMGFCVISVGHVFLFPLYSIHKNEPSMRTYFDLEQTLCISNISKPESWNNGKCPRHAIVTIKQGGRLGNQMWQYASVWALAKKTGLQPYIPHCIRNGLEQLFEGLTVPTFEAIRHCPVDPDDFVESLEVWNDTTQNIILHPFSFQIPKVLTLRHDIVKEFTFKKELQEKSQKVLKLALKSFPTENLTFVGIHVRRTDYLQYIKAKFNVAPVGLKFFQNAMKMFEEKYENVSFIVVSDDPNWFWQKFTYKHNVYVTGRPEKNSPELDMAILASCNHTIIDYGTYGEWGAILAGGDTIYTNGSHHSTAGKYLKNWYPI